jgi:hypothetical protein
MKLNKLQRHTAYIIMLAEIDRNSNKLSHFATDGFCYLACNILGLTDSNNGYDLIIDEYFPELNSKKPTVLSRFGLWFKLPITNIIGKEKRIELLKQCIKETF